MPTPAMPTALSTSPVNPSVGSVGANPIPYISSSEYQFAPTAMAIGTLVPGGTDTKQLQALADVIRRASRWADYICFGMDPAGKASLAASVSVESDYAKIVNGELRLNCDYKPIVQLVGLNVGATPTSASSVGDTTAGMARFLRRTIIVPMTTGVVFRTGDSPAALPPYGARAGRMYALWSYVFGYPHTRLAANVVAGTTSCSVTATDGNGGLWGVYAGNGSYLGTQLQVIDGINTETVSVTGITPNGAKTTLTTSPFQHAHTVPDAPDFIPVTALPEDIHQACITLASMLIKTSRGSRTMEMPARPGSQPDRQRLAQAGAMGNWENAKALLHDYGVRMKVARH